MMNPILLLMMAALILAGGLIELYRYLPTALWSWFLALVIGVLLAVFIIAIPATWLIWKGIKRGAHHVWTDKQNNP
jgi:hypothetical protein